MKFSSKTYRFGVTIVAGAALDLGVSMALSALVGVPLRWAAVVGFSCAVLQNYLLFELWVFGPRQVRISPARLALTAASSLVALSVRLAVIAGLSGYADPGPAGDFFRLGAAMAASIGVNFLIVNRIFRRLSVNASIDDR